jgi:hypothetical protein
VVGKDRTDKSPIDSKNYRRALQTATAHDYQFFGCETASGSLVIKNIALGNTHNRVPQVDPNTPGGWMMPTITGVRGQQVIDPYTGAQLTAVSIDADNGGGGSNGIYASDGGFSRQCPNTLFDAGDGTHGFLGVFWQYQQESGLMYYLPRTSRRYAEMPWRHIPYLIQRPADSRRAGAELFLFQHPDPGRLLQSHLKRKRPGCGQFLRFCCGLLQNARTIQPV